MKKIILFMILAAVCFLIGYSQKTGTIERKVKIEAMDEIVLQTGSASITMKKDGSILIQGKDISVNGTGDVSIKGSRDVIIKGKKVMDN